jgi:hypothetical protein
VQCTVRALVDFRVRFCHQRAELTTDSQRKLLSQGARSCRHRPTRYRGDMACLMAAGLHAEASDVVLAAVSHRDYRSAMR